MKKIVFASLFFMALESFVSLSARAENSGLAIEGHMSSDNGWTGSGGEILRDALNPWFVKNTTQVNYCVDFKASGLSISQSVAEEAVGASINYWKRQLAGDKQIAARVGVGQQNFVKVACSENTDLVFKFGHQSLSHTEKKFLKHPRDYLGVAVRTSYDKVNLKGRGFIFINSDKGPERFVVNDNIKEGSWSHSLNLFVVLIHEMGHVFGFPHTGSIISLMNEEFPESI